MNPRDADNDPKYNPSDKDYRGKFVDDIRKAEGEGTANDNTAIDTPEQAKNSESKPKPPAWRVDLTDPEDKAQKAKKWLKMTKNKGPITGIILTVIGGIIGIGGLLSPSLVLFNLKELYSSVLDYSDSARIIRGNKLVFAKFSNTKNAFAESADGKCNVMCKLGSINKNMLDNLKAGGYDVEVKESKGLLSTRYVITSMTLPGKDNIKVSNGKDFAKALEDPIHASNFHKAFNSRTAYFLNTKFGSMLSTKFGLDKLSKLSADIKDGVADRAAAARDAVKESIRKALGLSEKGTSNPNTKTESEIKASNAKAKALKAKLDKIDKKVGPLSIACTSYNVGRGVTFAVKHRKAIAFATFAMIFLVTADQAKAGDVDPDVMSTIGDQLTMPDENGKSATDSLGYRMAAYNDTTAPSEDDKKYSIALSGVSFGILSAFLSALPYLGEIGLTGVSKLCNLATGLAGDAVELGVGCSTEIIAAITAAAGSVGIGALPSALIGAGVCAAKIVAIQYIIGKALSAFIGKITTAVAENDLPDLSDETIGAAAGNAIYSGTAQIMGGAAAASGLKAGSEQEVKQYAIDTAPARRQQEDIAIYEARQTPFDIYNQYSFLGQIANNINVSALTGSSTISSLFKNTFSIIPKSLGMLSSNSLAETNSRASLYSGQCDDYAFESLGITADSLCNPSYVMVSDGLEADVFDTAQYMIDEKYIDEETGAAIVGSDYEKYLANCANRIEPIGETSSPIEDEDYIWKLGMPCVENSEAMSNFQAYTMDQTNQASMEGRYAEATPAPTTTEDADNEESAYILTDNDIAIIYNEIFDEINAQTDNQSSYLQTNNATNDKPISYAKPSNVIERCKTEGDDAYICNYSMSVHRSRLLSEIIV